MNQDLHDQSMQSDSKAAQASEDVRQAILSLEADGIHLYDRRYQIPFLATPRKLSLSFRVKQLACGAHHSVLLTEESQLYGCGLATSGQLGLIEETLQGRLPPCN